MNKAKFKVYDAGDKYNHKLFETVNLNPCGNTDQSDGLYQALKAVRPDLSDRDILDAITEERIKRCVMPIDTPMIRKLVKKFLPGYESVMINKAQSLLEVFSGVSSGKVVVRMGTKVAAYDADTGEIFTEISKLYIMRPVTELWIKEERGYKQVYAYNSGEHIPTLRDFINNYALPGKIYLCELGNHMVTIKDGKVWDTWDSSGSCPNMIFEN